MENNCSCFLHKKKIHQHTLIACLFLLVALAWVIDRQYGKDPVVRINLLFSFLILFGVSVYFKKKFVMLSTIVLIFYIGSYAVDPYSAFLYKNTKVIREIHSENVVIVEFIFPTGVSAAVVYDKKATCGESESPHDSICGNMRNPVCIGSAFSSKFNCRSLASKAGNYLMQRGEIKNL